MNNSSARKFDIVHKSPVISIDEINTVLSHYSSISNYSDGKWTLDLRGLSQNKNNRKKNVYFGNFPNDNLLHEAKIWASKLIIRKFSTPGISGYIGHLRFFSSFIESNAAYSFSEITPQSFSIFHQHLFQESQNTLKTNLECWVRVKDFFRDMEFFDQYYIMEKYIVPKFPKTRFFAYKYIPDYITNQLDVLFKKEDIPHAYKTFYWTLRLIPNRVTEVASMTVNCLKPISSDQYILTISTPKQSGPYESSMLKLIEIQDVGIGSYLIDLFKKQIEFTKNLDTSMKITNYLFYSNACRFYRPHKKILTYNKFKLIDADDFARFLKNMCQFYDVKDDKGNPFNPTSHQFRHNAISDRMNSGIFRAIDIKPLTGHHTTAMIEQTYTHTHVKDLKKESPVVFRGRIINTDDEDRMNRLLAKPFSRRIHNLGICSDSRVCNKSKSQCLRCEYFLPDFENLSYYEYDQIEWKKKKEKAEQVGNVDYAELCQDWIDSYEVAIKRVLSAITNESLDSSLEGDDETNQ